MNSAIQPILKEPLPVKTAEDSNVVYNFTHFLNNLLKTIFFNINQTAKFFCGFVLPGNSDLTSSPKPEGKACHLFERETYTHFKTLGYG
jgi:hypothetical protein